MKIDISNKEFSPYNYLSAELEEWARQNNCYDDLVVDIYTSNLGKMRILALQDNYGYDFNTDWAEGNFELELLAITPVNEIGELKYKL